MKILLSVFLISFAASISAQTLPLDVKQKLSIMLKLKRDSEAEWPVTNETDSGLFKSYREAYHDLMKNRETVIAAINEYLETDSIALKTNKTTYNWQNPISSHIYLISESYYYRIVKYSLEKQLVTLPPLREVPFKD